MIKKCKILLGILVILITDNSVISQSLDTVIIENNFEKIYTSDTLKAQPVNLSADTKLIYDWKADKGDGNGFKSIKILDMPMDGGALESGKVKDYSGGNYHGTLHNVTYKPNSGFDNKGCYYFNGSSKIAINDASANIDRSKNVTLTAWINPEPFTYYCTIFGRYQAGVCYKQFSVRASDNNLIMFFDASTYFNGGVVTLNTWSFVAFVLDYDKKMAYIYLNGVETARKSLNEAHFTQAGPDLEIGSWNSPNNNQDFVGHMDEIAIYDRALSSQQIKSMYNDYSTTNKFRTDILLPQETNLNEKWKVCAVPNNNTSDGISKCSHEYEIFSSTLSGVKINEKNYANVNDNLKAIPVNLRPENSKLICNWKKSTDGGSSWKELKVLDLPMDGGAMESGKVKEYINDNNATVNSAEYVSESGVDERGAYKFDGTDDYLSGTSFGALTEGSISVWAKWSSKSTTSILWNYGNAVGGGFDEASLGISSMWGDNICFGIFNPTWIHVDSGVNPEVDRWYHIVVSWGSQGLKIYVDGVHKNTNSSYTGAMPDAINWVLGSNSYTNSSKGFMHGYIDEFSLWGEVLSDSQVVNLFNKKTDIIDSGYTNINDKWQVCATATDNFTYSNTMCNTITIQPPKNCKELNDLGNTISGLYMIDPDGDGNQHSREVYCDMTGTEYNTTSVSSNTALRSCMEHLVLYSSNSGVNGMYLIDQDGTESVFDPKIVACDMVTDGGGWTHLLNPTSSGYSGGAYAYLNKSVGSGDGGPYIHTYSNVSEAYYQIHTYDADASASLTVDWVNTINANELLYMAASSSRSTGNPTFKVNGVSLSPNKSITCGGSQYYKFFVESGSPTCSNNGTVNNSNAEFGGLTRKKISFSGDLNVVMNVSGTVSSPSVSGFAVRENKNSYYSYENSCIAHKLMGRITDGQYVIKPEGVAYEYTVYCDMTSSDFATGSESASTALKSCMNHLAWYPSNAGKDGTYLIDPDGIGGDSPYKVECDMTKDGGGWTRIDHDIARNKMDGTVTVVDGASIAEFDSQNRYRTRDGDESHAYLYDINVKFGYNQFYFDNYKAKAYAKSGNKSEIIPSLFKISDWNTLFIAGGYGDIAFGSPEQPPLTSYANVGITVDCESCETLFQPNQTVYSLNKLSNKFRIGWGEDGMEFEGWYPWYSGYIYVRESAAKYSGAEVSCLEHLRKGRTTDGVYLIDPDGEGSIEPFEAYCDMTTDGGGWMRLEPQHGSYSWQYDICGGNNDADCAPPSLASSDHKQFASGIVGEIVYKTYDGTELTADMFDYFINGASEVKNNVIIHFNDLDADYDWNGVLHYHNSAQVDFIANNESISVIANNQWGEAQTEFKEKYVNNKALQKVNITFQGNWGMFLKFNSGYILVRGDITTEKSCKHHYLKGNKTDGIYKIDPDGDGAIQPFEVYCDMTSQDFATNSVSASTALKSCMEHLVYYSDNYTKDGVYMIDTDGAYGTEPPFKAYCDMTTEGGGWTLVANMNKDNIAITTGLSAVNNKNVNMVNTGTFDIEFDQIREKSYDIFNYSFTTKQKLSDGVDSKNPDGIINAERLDLYLGRNTSFSLGNDACSSSETAKHIGDGFYFAWNTYYNCGFKKGAYGTAYNGSGSNDWDIYVYSLGDVNRQSTLWIRNNSQINNISKEKSCQHHYLNNRRVDGVYKIDPDGDGSIAEFEAYCDMTTDDGGWTLVHKNDRATNSDSDKTDDGYNISALSSLEIDNTAILPKTTTELLGETFRINTNDNSYKMFWQYSSMSDVYYSMLTNTTKPVGLNIKTKTEWSAVWNNAVIDPSTDDNQHSFIIWQLDGSNNKQEHIAFRRDIGDLGSFWFNGGVWLPGSYKPGAVWIKNTLITKPDITMFKSSKTKIEYGSEIKLDWNVSDAVKFEILSYDDSNLLTPVDVSSKSDYTFTPKSNKTYATYIFRVTSSDGIISEKELTIFFSENIPYSLRFNSDNSNYLKSELTELGDRKKWTFSAWIKLGNTDVAGSNIQTLFASGVIGEPTKGSVFLALNNEGKLWFNASNDHTSLHADYISSDKIESTSEWTHITVVYNSTESDQNNRFKAFVNGIQIAMTASTPIDLDRELMINSQGHSHTLGAFYRNCTSNDCQNIDNTLPSLTGSQDYPHLFDGYMSEVYFIDGYALSANKFGRQNNGKWIAQTPSIDNYGTNGFYLNFYDQSYIGKDFSGNHNHFIPEGYSARKDGNKYIDQMLDSPDRNFAVLDITTAPTGNIFSDGNLGMYYNGTDYATVVYSTLSFTDNKYIEILQSIMSYTSDAIYGARDANDIKYNVKPGDDSNSWAWYTRKTTAMKYHNSSGSNYGDLSVVGDSFIMAISTNEGKIWVGKNGSWFNSGNLESGTNEMYSGLPNNLIFAIRGGINRTAKNMEINFGQGGQNNLNNYVKNQDGSWRLSESYEVPDARFRFLPPSGYYPLSKIVVRSQNRRVIITIIDL